jgi:4-amino-4-deoxy-L-arabinose transferase-like glycosyltransferase
VALASVLALAAVLRFGGLGWGLRHEPHIDERYFVENVGWMLAHRDLDHRFDEYPGLFFYMLTPVLAWFGPPRFGPEAYLAARAVVAAFGVASVGVVYALGVRLAGPATGLAAALFLAVSPVEVQTAHMVRPDIALETVALCALLAMTRVGRRTRDDAIAGAWMGAAAAVKFTGGLLVPSYLARRLCVPGARVRGMGAASLAAIVVFALCSPHTLLDLRGGLSGFATQVGYHYDVRPRGEQHFAGMAMTYGLVLLRAVHAIPLALAALGVVLARREWRRWLPLWLFPLTIVAVFSTAEVHHDRFVVPALGVVALCAGEAVRRIGGRWAWPLACVAALAPLLASVDYVSGVRRPSTRDLALDRVLADVPPGASVVTTVTDLGLPSDRYHVLPTVGLDEARARLLAAHADMVVAQPVVDEELLGGLRTIARVEPPNRHAGPPIVLAVPARPARYEPIDLRSAVVTASESLERVPALLDGDFATSWSTAGPQGGDWIEVSLPQPARIGRVELRVPGRGRLYGRNIHVLVSGPDGSMSRVAVVAGLPPIDPGAQAGARQLLLFAPVVTTRIRLAQVAEAARPWGVAELRIDRRIDEPAVSEVIKSVDP